MIRILPTLLVIFFASTGCRPNPDVVKGDASATTAAIRPSSPTPKVVDNPTYEHAVQLARQGRFAAAEVLFDEVVQANPANTDALRNRGACRAQLKRLDEAIKDLDAVLSRSPADAAAHYNRGFALSELERYAEAVEAYSRSIQSRADYAPAFVSRGLVSVKLNDDRAAVKDFTRAIELNPKLREAYLLRAEAHHRQFEYAKAREDVERAEKLAR